MVLLFFLLVLVLGVIAALVVSENPTLVTVYIAFIEVTSSIGVVIVSAFGAGMLVGALSMLGRNGGGAGSIEKD